MGNTAQATAVQGRRFIYAGAKLLVGNPLVGGGQCVELVQRYTPMIGHTSTWKAGPRLFDITPDDIAIGTVIATMEHGKWPGRSHNNHTGYYGGTIERDPITRKIKRFVIIEQFVDPGFVLIAARVLYNRGGSGEGMYPDNSNNAAAFYVVEK